MAETSFHISKYTSFSAWFDFFHDSQLEKRVRRQEEWHPQDNNKKSFINQSSESCDFYLNHIIVYFCDKNVTISCCCPFADSLLLVTYSRLRVSVRVRPLVSARELERRSSRENRLGLKQWFLTRGRLKPGDRVPLGGLSKIPSGPRRYLNW